MEARAQANRVVSPGRMWLTLVNKEVLTKVHHFETVRWQDVGEKRFYHELPRLPDKAAYTPSCRKPVLALHKVSSTKEKASSSVSPFSLLRVPRSLSMVYYMYLYGLNRL